ncbi:MAG TPA: hypothetical protein VE130_12590 [Nitrososphaeraceae archaeon]|nr:hypothetical protein [Nitrososphaeraceae archaeon]
MNTYVNVVICISQFTVLKDREKACVNHAQPKNTSRRFSDSGALRDV